MLFRSMDVTVVRDKTQYTLHFEKGENVGGLQKSETRSVQTGKMCIRDRPGPMPSFEPNEALPQEKGHHDRKSGGAAVAIVSIVAVPVSYTHLTMFAV